MSTEGVRSQVSQAEMLSRSARSRIRLFSAVVSVVGLVLIGLVGFTTLNDADEPSGSQVFTYEDYYDPWENPNPTEATRDGNSYTARGQAVIRLSGLTAGAPLVLEYDIEGPIRGVYVTGPDARFADEVYGPPEFSTYDGPLYVIPSQPDVELWVDVRDTEAWSLEIDEADLEERSGTVSGIGSDAFLYTGPATTARITARGDYSVSVDLVSETGVEDLYSSYEVSSTSVAWRDTNAAIFLVDSYGDTAWSIEFFEPTATPAPTPDPTAEEAPDE